MGDSICMGSVQRSYLKNKQRCGSFLSSAFSVEEEEEEVAL
jgi:hypothetical protein